MVARFSDDFYSPSRILYCKRYQTNTARLKSLRREADILILKLPFYFGSEIQSHASNVNLLIDRATALSSPHNAVRRGGADALVEALVS